VFNPSATYITFTTGGFGAKTQVTNNCSGLSGTLQPVIQCCDPQKQDCTTKDANTPLCVCDEGDASNTVGVVPGTNTPDPAGACVEGGTRTCCSPRLNGGSTDWCNANMGSGSICADEVGDQCVASGTPATYTSPDGQSQPITAADLVLSKPSPFIYLFIRPDAQMNGQQCCMTEWCNICPQEYANAYGLSLIRSNMQQATSDTGNASIIGKGWPFSSSTSATGATSYQVPLHELDYTIKWTISGGSDDILDIRNPNPILFMSNNIANKPLSAAIEACNSLAGGKWQTQYTDKQMDNDMGFVYDYWQGETINGRSELHSMSTLPSPQETPLAYMNRLRSAVATGSTTPLPDIPLCSDTVKICYGTTATSTLNNTAGTISNNQGTSSSQDPSNTVAPPTTTTTTGTNTGGTGGAPVTQSPGVVQSPAIQTNGASPTQVPSAGNGSQVNPSLF
jgi:hypothetical protein